MKKFVLAVLLIGIAVVIAAPFANGLIMERVVRQARTDINKMYADTGHDLSIDIIDYDRGYAASRIKWKISLGKLRTFYGVDDIIVVDEAKHGFTGVISKSSLVENQWYTDLVNEKLHGKNPVDVTTRCNLLGHIESRVLLDAFSVQTGGEVLNIRPGRIVVALPRGLWSFSSRGSWDGLSIADQLDLGGISFFSKMEKISPFIWDGNGSFAIASAGITADKTHVELANLKLGFTMDYEKSADTVSLGVDYGVDHFDTGDNRIENAFVRLGVNGMDARGYENLAKLYTQIMNTTMSTMAQGKNDPEKLQAAMRQQMMSNGMQLVMAMENILKDGLEIQVSDLKASLPQGQITGHIVLGLKKDMTMAQFIPILGQPSLALDIFSLQSEMRMPAGLGGEDPKLFTPLYPGMQTGLFEKKGDQMVHKAETRDGKLYLNGQEVLLD